MTVEVRYLVHDVNAAAEFYLSHLGFTDEENWGAPFRMLSRGELRLWVSGPELVDMKAAGPQPTAKFRLAAMQAGWARAPRPWDKYTEDSGAGDPRAATPEKGARFFEAVTQELATFLVELSNAKIDATFPFQT